MYTGQEIPPLPEVVYSADFADGMVRLCRQSALVFGSDRRTSVDARPAVLIKADADRFVVLPCTTSIPRTPSDFFELSAERVMWTSPDVNCSFAFWRYEVVLESALHTKIGILNHPSRISLLAWLIRKF